jgi:type II restriction/modification system DNA methylase subunit YeeA
MYGEEVPLNELYKFHENRTKIDKYSNRKPLFSEEDGAYTLNFGGKAECRSIKNFILESSTGSDVIVFGKVNDEKFNLLMSHPLSALVGMAVALTSFDNRLLFSE